MQGLGVPTVLGFRERCTWVGFGFVCFRGTGVGLGLGLRVYGLGVPGHSITVKGVRNDSIGIYKDM